MCLNPSIIKYGLDNKPLVVPCGKCIECRSIRTDEWATRIILESRQHKQNCFISLTYNDDNLPKGKTLSKGDYQKFLKRLRIFLARSANIKIRYFGCGEYGSEGGRPHYHFIIFGWCPSDLRYFFTDDNGCKIYQSKTLADIWGNGFVTVGVDLNKKTVKYVAKYLQKYDNTEYKIKPFITMSTRPGIGACAVKKSMLNDNHLYFDGQVKPLPRYFKKVLERLFPEEYAVFSKSNLDKYLKVCREAVTFVYTDIPSYKRSWNIVGDTIIKCVDPNYSVGKNSQFITVFYENSEYYKKLTSRRKKILSKKIGKCLDINFVLDYNLYRSLTVRKT